MPLHSDGRRERIIVFGDYGSGKSQAWVDIARMLRLTKAPGKMHVLSTDMGAYASTEQAKGWEENVVIKDIETFDEMADAVKTRRSSDSRDDWLVVDRSDTVWDAVQSSFALDVSGKDLDVWAVERLAAGEESPFSDGHGVSWGIIKRRYNEHFANQIMRYPGHVLLCAMSRDVATPNSSGKGGDGADVIEYYGRQGLRPSGEKHTGFLMHDIVLMGSKNVGSGKTLHKEWVMTSIRARSRRLVTNQRVGNFVTDYLMPVGGWTT